MEKICMTIKAAQCARNEMHFHTQLTERAHIFKAKKGKGSYVRKPKYGWSF